MREEACERGVEMSKRMDEMREKLWEKASELLKHQILRELAEIYLT